MSKKNQISILEKKKTFPISNKKKKTNLFKFPRKKSNFRSFQRNPKFAKKMSKIKRKLLKLKKKPNFQNDEVL